MATALTVHVIVSSLRSHLLDIACPETRALQGCGSTAYRLLCNALRALDSPNGDILSMDHTRSYLDTLLALANDHINAVDFRAVQACWLRLYTDASILRSALDMLYFDSETPRAQWLTTARRLDMATIVAGGIGEGRAAWIASLLQQVHTMGLAASAPKSISTSPPPSSSSSPDRPAKRIKRATSFSYLATYRPSSIYAASAVPVRRPPSMQEYADRLSPSPFIVRNYANDPASAMPPWPALDRWSDASYLLKTVGEGRVVPVEIGHSYSDAGWGQEIMPLRDFLQRVGYEVDPESELDSLPTEPLYLAQHSLFRQFPQLERDYSIPDYVWSRPEPDAHTTYQPVSDAERPIVNVWIGNSEDHPVSPAHTDPHFNCYVQVLGRKRVWLAPPSVSGFMNAFGSVTDADDDVDEAEINRFMDNTSRVPIFRSNDDEATKARHPLFFEHVAPLAMEAVLEPGDLLVMPPGWWHAMKGEGRGPGWSISMWY